MPLQCTNCPAQLSDRRALNKLLLRKHDIHPNVPTFSCFSCSEQVKSLPSLRKHSQVSHHQPILKVCYACRMRFQSKFDFARHINNEHGHPVYEMDSVKSSPATPVVSSIKGGINYYELHPASNDLDIMEYLFRKRNEIEEIIRKHTNHYPQKKELMVEMTLQKPGEEPEKVSVYFNTNTTTVYYTGITDTVFEELVDNTVSKLISFLSYGSGWQLQKIDKITVKLVRYIPVRGSSFIPFPDNYPLRRDSNLLNIHNANDDKCFLYCFTAGYHLVFLKEKLEPPRPCLRPRTNILIYSSENPSAKQPIGEFDMPMCLLDISKFEDLNEVQVNVFR